MKKRRMQISGATRHDMSVGCEEWVSGHEVVYLSAGKNDSGTYSPWQSRCPIVTPNGPGTNNIVDAWGVTVTDHSKKTQDMRDNNSGLRLAPVCVVAVSGPVTVFHEWREQNPDEARQHKMTRCRDYVDSRGLVLHDARPGIGMDVVLYDSWDRANAIGAI